MSKKNKLTITDKSNSYTVEVKNVTVMVHTLIAGPNGVIHPGTILKLPYAEAEPLLRGGHAEVIEVEQHYKTIGSTEIADAPQEYETRANE